MMSELECSTLWAAVSIVRLTAPEATVKVLRKEDGPGCERRLSFGLQTLS